MFTIGNKVIFSSDINHHIKIEIFTISNVKKTLFDNIYFIELFEYPEHFFLSEEFTTISKLRKQKLDKINENK